MIHFVQLLGGVFGLAIAWSIWKIIDIREEKAHQKELEEVRKQYNK